jgi:putative endonuclease
MIVVYVLYSHKLSKYYVGCTGQLETRLDQHNNGRNKFTSKGIPWDLIRIFPCENRAKAMQLELKIKKRGIRRYLSEN